MPTHRYKSSISVGFDHHYNRIWQDCEGRMRNLLFVNSAFHIVDWPADSAGEELCSASPQPGDIGLQQPGVWEIPSNNFHVIILAWTVRSNLR